MGRAGRAAAGAAAPPGPPGLGRGSPAPVLAGLVGAGGAVLGAADLRARLLHVDPDHPGDLAGEGVDLRPVPDARDQPRRLAQRVDPAVGAVEVVLAHDVAEHEPVERHPAGDELAHRRLPLLQPQVAGVEAAGLDRDVGLRHEVLVAVERAERGLLTRGVAVEGEDHLAAELLVVEQEPPQHPRVVVAEGRAAGGDGGRHAGEVARHHVGVALDDHRLRRLRDLATGQVEAVEHLALLVERGLGGVEVLRLDPVVVEDPPGPEADRVAARLPDRPEQPPPEAVVRRPARPRPARPRPAPPRVKPFWRRCRSSASPSRGANPMPN